MSRAFPKLSALDKRILNRLQEDIPFKARPWELIARELGIKEGHLLNRIAFFKKNGIVRRISAVFSPRKINFVSTLVAVKVTPGNITRVAKRINSYSEVTHNYRREGLYDLWFTLVAKDKLRITRILNRLKMEKDIKTISEFPMVKLFKIDVKFPC